MARPPAFLARRFTQPVEARLHELYRLTVNEDDGILSPLELAAAAAGSEVVFVSATETVDAGVLQALAPGLKAVATLSVGFNHIDLEAARQRGVAVLHTPDVLSDACAEVGMLLLLNAARRAYEADRLVRSGRWAGWGPTQLLGRGLVGRRLGIFGLGRIGRAFAARARPFGLEIHYHNRSRLEAGLELGAIYHDSLDQLLPASDFLAVCAPSAPGLKGVLDARRLALLPAGAVLVNISRGDLVDDEALIDALAAGRLFAAGLDVFANEPRVDPRYAGLDNVFLTPHIGSATHETRDAMGFLLIEGLQALGRGEPASNRLV